MRHSVVRWIAYMGAFVTSVAVVGFMLGVLVAHYAERIPPTQKVREYEGYISLLSALATTAAVGAALLPWWLTSMAKRRSERLFAEIACDRIFGQLCSAWVSAKIVHDVVSGATMHSHYSTIVEVFLRQQDQLRDELTVFDVDSLATIAAGQPELAVDIRAGTWKLRAARDRMRRHNVYGDWSPSSDFWQREVEEWNRLLREGFKMITRARDQAAKLTGNRWEDPVPASWSNAPLHAPTHRLPS